MLRSLGLYLAVVLFVAGAASAQETETRDALLDPLPVRDLFLLGNGFYSFEPEGPKVLDIGEWRMDIHQAEANTFSKSNWISVSLAADQPATRERAIDLLNSPRYKLRDSVFLAVGVTHRSTIGLHRGLGNHVEIGIAIPVTAIGGGWSDALVEAVHHALRTGNADRNALTQNIETVYVRAPGVLYVRDRSAGYAIGDVALTAKYELSRMEDEKLSIAVAGSVELPTGHAATLDGSGSIDAGARLIVSRNLGGGRLNASFGVLRLGANTTLGLRPQVLITDTVGYSHRVTDVTAFVTQLTVSETPFRQYNMPELSRRSYELSIGAQHAMRGFILHGAFIENVITFANSADAALQWGISRCRTGRALLRDGLSGRGWPVGGNLAPSNDRSLVETDRSPVAGCDDGRQHHNRLRCRRRISRRWSIWSAS